MSVIIEKVEIAPKIFQLVVEAPRIAAKGLPGQFVVVMAHPTGERIPLTIADFDRRQGTVTLVVMVVGTSTLKLCHMEVGETLHALIGPLGKPSEIDAHRAVLMVAGGVGAAPVFPIARAFRERGSRVITIHGARSRGLLFWQDRLAAVSDSYIVTTDDGSAGVKGVVTGPLVEQLQADADHSIGCVYAIGPAVMMKFCAQATRPFGVKTVVSLNPIMIDGTGMCGGCRVEIAGRTQFTCVDGPEFDGHDVNWDLLLSRQRIYCRQEADSLRQLVETPR